MSAKTWVCFCKVGCFYNADYGKWIHKDFLWYVYLFTISILFEMKLGQLSCLVSSEQKLKLGKTDGSWSLERAKVGLKLALVSCKQVHSGVSPVFFLETCLPFQWVQWLDPLVEELWTPMVEIDKKFPIPLTFLAK